MRQILISTAVVLLASFSALADEVKATSQIESIAMFKNGLAIIPRNLEVTGPGVYRLDDVPTPIHGTFWVDGEVPVESQMTLGEAEGPLTDRGADFQSSLVGRQVTIRLKDGAAAVSGKVLKLARAKGDGAWDRNYGSPQYWNGQQWIRTQFLVLQTEKSSIYVDSNQISFMQVDGSPDSIHQMRPALLLTVGGEKKNSTIHISYVTKGISWAPGYRINLVDDKNLTIEQQAVIKNELQDLHDAELQLVSGFPSFRFGHVSARLP